jgi:hypothetical protein
MNTFGGATFKNGRAKHTQAYEYTAVFVIYIFLSSSTRKTFVVYSLN